jgi:hypothetical protein
LQPFFLPLFPRLAEHHNFNPEWLPIEDVAQNLVPDSCFQGLKEATSRKVEALADGPFGAPAEPLEHVIIPLGSSPPTAIPNPTWDCRNKLLAYELWRLWSIVLREICDQHAAIDSEEKSNVAIALMELSPFERLAGKMFYEANDLTRVPDDVFATMGRHLDEEHIPSSRISAQKAEKS